MRNKTIGAVGLAAAIGLGSLIASPAGAEPSRGATAPEAPGAGTGSTNREWYFGSGGCIWGMFSIGNNQVMIRKRCPEERDEDKNW